MVNNLTAEPPYDGLTTCLFSIRAPELTAHGITERCQIECPHLIAECGEWRDEPEAPNA